VEVGGGVVAEAAATVFVAVVPDAAAGAAEESVVAEEPEAPGVAAAWPAKACLRGAAACRGCSAAWPGVTAVVFKRETGEAAGLRRSMKRKSRRRGDGRTTGEEAAIF
jgi:hypothetical protein